MDIVPTKKLSVYLNSGGLRMELKQSGLNVNLEQVSCENQKWCFRKLYLLKIPFNIISINTFLPNAITWIPFTML